MLALYIKLTLTLNLCHVLFKTEFKDLEVLGRQKTPFLLKYVCISITFENGKTVCKEIEMLGTRRNLDTFFVGVVLCGDSLAVAFVYL